MPEAYKATAEKLANAMTVFANDYLPKAEQVSEGLVFSKDFADGNRDGWFELDDDSSTLPVS